MLRSLETGWLTTGPFARQLESEFAVYAEAPLALAVSSCTAAMYLALRALGIGEGEGDEVITTPLTWPATANVIVRAGARPVFVDVDEATLCLDPAAVAAAITPRTRAIMPVHYAGHPCDLAALEATLRASTGCGSSRTPRTPPRRGSPTGARSARSATSPASASTPTRTSRPARAACSRSSTRRSPARITSLRLHGLTRDSWKRYEKKGPGAYDVLEPGYKLNLSDLHAGVALGQLHRLEEHHERRVAQAERYDEGLAGPRGHHAARAPPGRRRRPRLAHLRRADRARGRRSRSRRLRRGARRGGDRHGPALPARARPDVLPRGPPDAARCRWPRRAGAEVLSLPLSPAHSLADVDDVVAAVRRLHAHFTR